MIRPTVPADTPALIDMTHGTGLFLPLDLRTLDEVLADYHAKYAAEGHRCVTFEQGGQPIGFAYYALTPLTDRNWTLWWIVVSKQIQARGIGGQLLKHVEEAARRENGRMLFIETSGLPTYELTRRFYLKHGYDLAGTLREWYAAAHDMVIFSKRLTAAS